MRPFEICYLSLGSNMGTRVTFLEAARLAIHSLPHVWVTGQSPIYETEPVGCEDQSWFLNQVISLQTNLSPFELLTACQEIEINQGRVRSDPNVSRTLDIDILFYGNQVISRDSLEIPHPRIPQRRFVLLPLADLSPEWVHPVLEKTVKQMLRELKTTHKVMAYTPKSPQGIHLKGDRLWI